MTLFDTQITAIKTHWFDKVKGNLQIVGNAMFSKYLSLYPEDITVFPKFSTVSPCLFYSDKQFNQQTLTVISYLDKVVEALGVNAEEMMKAKIITHEPIGVTTEHLEKMLKLIGDVMHTEFDADTITTYAWKMAAIDLIAAMK